MTANVYVIGAGLAGLSTALHLTGQGYRVHLFEAAGHGGGRCRSFYDARLESRIDNGNHLLLSGNRSAMAYLERIGARNTLISPTNGAFPFLDLISGDRWEVRPDPSPIPWSLLSARHRVPGAGLGEYMRALSLAWASPEATVQACLDRGGVLFERFWEPLAVSVLNTEAEKAAAAPLWPVLKETFGRGAKACRPLMVKEGLSESFVQPAIECLAAEGAQVHFNQRLRSISLSNNRVGNLQFGDRRISLEAEDQVVLAVSPTVAQALVPDIDAPDEFRSIVNGHFRLPNGPRRQSLLGLVGGVSHWMFVRGEIASITVSAADALAAQSNEAIAEMLWPEICTALGLGDTPLGANRIVNEKRASFAQTPEQLNKRPGARTAINNLLLAGDWTDTGLPATIEGAIRSGDKAAKIILSASST